ncbi:fibrohexamerin-like [Bicyclus anynana]|uniref:Fibrohexamerin-like n=1 Tax=Bicyclus anynana TaxID=110368 RepID=A0ABM3LVA8_BICAN|nr:fibrohexamerin-like [Bicyclus anynana]
MDVPDIDIPDIAHIADMDVACPAFHIAIIPTPSDRGLPPIIVWPCQSIGCIARSLAARSRCDARVPGYMPSTFRVKSFRFDTPFFNATYVDNDLVIGNQDKCFVSQYYYNTATKKAVLGIDCPNLELESTRTVIQHYSLREDVVYDYSYQGTYPLIRMTVELPARKPFDLCSAFIFTDVTALPYYRIKPNNQLTADVLSKDDKLLNIFERETFFYRGPHLARHFINSVLCDFGCN